VYVAVVKRGKDAHALFVGFTHICPNAEFGSFEESELIPISYEKCSWSCRFPKMALPPTIASLWRVAFRKFWRTRKKRFGGRRFPRGVPEKFLSHIWIRTFLVTGDRETMTRRHTLTTPSQKYLPYCRWLPGQINYTYIWSTKFIFYTCKLSISVAKIIITK
jgi:hypothetical protein